MTDVTPPMPPTTGSIPPDDEDRSLLSAYLDDELTLDEGARVENRLAASPEWRAELDDVRIARDALRSLEVGAEPDGFWDRVEAAVAAAPDTAGAGDRSETEPAIATGVTRLDDHRGRRRSRRRLVAWASGGVAAALVFGAMFVIPGRRQVRPNVAAVVTHHGATSANQGDPISGLVPIAPMRSSR